MIIILIQIDIRRTKMKTSMANAIYNLQLDVRFRQFSILLLVLYAFLSTFSILSFSFSILFPWSVSSTPVLSTTTLTPFTFRITPSNALSLSSSIRRYCISISSSFFIFTKYYKQAINSKIKALQSEQKMKKDVYAYPPDINKCEKHRLATRIFKGLQEDEDGQECQCCGRRIGIEEADTNCCYSNNQLAFLGPGLPLFFTFIKVSIIIFIIISLVFSLFAVISNILAGSCQKYQKCSRNIFNTLSIVNKIDQTNYLSIQNYVLLAFVLIFIVAMHFFRYTFRKVNNECDEVTDSPSDYAAILRRLPQGTTEQDIIELVNWRRQQMSNKQKQQTDNLKIVKIVMAFEMGDYLRKIEQNKQKYKKSIKEDDQFIPEPLPTLDKPAKLAIIIFSRQKSKDYFIYKPNFIQNILSCICDPLVPLSDFHIKNEYVSVDRAPQPDDIKWENANISVSGAIVRKTIYTFFSVCLLLAGAAAQYGLAVFQNSLTNQTLIFYLGTASSVLVSIMNQIILQFLYFSSTKQRNQTETEVNKSLTIKISVFMFLNAGVFIVAANILADFKSFSLEGNFSNQVTQIMILNSLTPNLSLLAMDYLEIVGRIKRWLVRKQKMVFLQIEANRMYEKPAASMPYKYGYVIRTLWLTAFYCPLVPIVVPISALGLVLNYWIQKCLHSKSYRCPTMVSNMVNQTATELLEYIPLIVSGGQFLIYLYFRNFRIDLLPVYWSVPIYIAIGLSVMNILCPMEEFNKKYFKLQDIEQDTLEYNEAQQNFDVTYEMLNPAYVCNRKRKRDKMLLKSIFGKVDQLTQMNTNQQSGNPIKDALLSPLMNHQNNQPTSSGNPINPALLLFQPHAQNNYYQQPQNVNPYGIERESQKLNMFDVMFKNQQVFFGFNNERYF